MNQEHMSIDKKIEPRLKDLKISTRTVIATIKNCKFDISNIFEFFPMESRLNPDIQLIFMYNNTNTKGICPPHKLNKKKKNSFRNSLNLIISYKNNTYNIKISRLGKLHITGAKQVEDTSTVIKFILETFITMNDSNRDACVQFENDDVIITLDVIMTNFIFDCHFKIDKEKLNKILNNTQNKFINLFLCSFGYTGLNMKKPLAFDTLKDKVYSQVYTLHDFRNAKSFVSNTDIWKETKEERTCFGKKKHSFNTWLVFHSGKVIVSGIEEKVMEEDFLEFREFIMKHRSLIEEKIDV